MCIVVEEGFVCVMVCEEGVWLLWFNWDIFNREKSRIKSVMARLAMRGRKNEF